MRRNGETCPRRSRTRGRLIAALAIGVGASCATTPFRGDTGIKPFAFDLWDVHCPSGLRVVIERTPGSPVVGVTTLVGVGSRQDPEGRDGLAHVVEHLTFRSHLPGQPILWDRVLALGGTFNGHTDFDSTTYETYGPKDSLRGLLEIEGQRLAQPLVGVDEATFPIELEVVRNELRERTETDASQFGFLGIEQAVFPASHPYSRPTIGNHDSLSRLTLDDARQFVASHYRPEDMTVVVAGDVDLAHVEDLVRQALPPALYGDAAHPRPVAPAGSRKPPPAAPPAPPAAPPALPRLTAAVSTPELWIAWTAPGGYGGEPFVAEFWAWLAQALFSQGQFDDPDIVGIDVFATRHVLASTIICRVRLTQGAHPDESLKKVLEEVPWQGEEDIFLDARLRVRKTSALRTLAFSSEDIAERSLRRVAYAHYTGSLAFYSEAVAAVQAITPGQARDVAKTYLQSERARAILVEPIAAGASKTAPREGDGARPRRVAPDVKHAPLSPPTMAALAAVKHLRDLRRFTLPSGLEVVIVPRPGAPVITAELGLHGGSATAVPGMLIAAGTGLDLDFAESPGDYGIGMSFHNFGADLSTAAVAAGTANLQRALDILVFALRSYRVDWPTDKFQSVTLPYLRKLEADPIVKFHRIYEESLFKGHPYGRISTPDEIAAIKKADVTSWLGRIYSPHNAMLVVVGDVVPADVEAVVRDSFEGWTSESGVVGPPAAFSPTPVAGGGSGGSSLDGVDVFQVVDRPGATQAVMRLGCLLPDGDARTDAVRDLAAWSASQRLGTDLRHKYGSTYGLHAWATPYRTGGGSLEITTDVDNAGLGHAIGRLRSYWRRASQGKALARRDLEAGQGALASGRLLDYEESRSLAGAVLLAWGKGWPLDSVDHYADYLTSATIEEVNGILTTCAHGLSATLLGDEKVIRAALASGAAAEAEPAGPPEPEDEVEPARPSTPYTPDTPAPVPVPVPPGPKAPAPTPVPPTPPAPVPPTLTAPTPPRQMPQPAPPLSSPSPTLPDVPKAARSSSGSGAAPPAQ